MLLLAIQDKGFRLLRTSRNRTLERHWMTSRARQAISGNIDIRTNSADLIVPLVYSNTGVITFPFVSMALDMLNTVKIVEIFKKSEASARNLPGHILSALLISAGHTMVDLRLTVFQTRRRRLEDLSPAHGHRNVGIVLD